MDLHISFPDLLHADPGRLPTLPSHGPGTRVAAALSSAELAWRTTLVDAHRCVDKQVAAMTALSRGLLELDATLAGHLR